MELYMDRDRSRDRGRHMNGNRDRENTDRDRDEVWIGIVAGIRNEYLSRDSDWL